MIFTIIVERFCCIKTVRGNKKKKKCLKNIRPNYIIDKCKRLFV